MDLVPLFTFPDYDEDELATESVDEIAVVDGFIHGRYDFDTSFFALRPWAMRFVQTPGIRR